MNVIRYLSERKLLTFILATLILQLTVLVFGFSLKSLESDSDHEDLFSQSLELSEQEFNQGDEQAYLPDVEVVDPISQVKTISHQIRPGDTLSRIWSRYCVSSTPAISAFDALKAAGIGVSALRAGLIAEISLENGEITRFEIELADARKVLLERDDSDGFRASIQEPQIIETERTISGVIQSSFAAAAGENKIPYQVVDQLVDLFGARIEFRRNVQPGDSFSIMYTERKLADGRVLEPGAIKGASFQNEGRWMAAVAHTDENGEIVFYDEQGRPLGEFFLRYPLQFSRISSVFSTARFHPILKRVRPHNGVDFAAPIGTPVRSVGAGVVEDAGYRGGGGKMVKIRHNEKYATAYLHLHTISKEVRRGSRVSRGQVIGTVGMTGTATGPHLHYSLYINGKYTDPMKAELPQIPTSNSKIPRDYFDDVILALKTSQDNLQLALNNQTVANRKIG